MTYEPPTLSGLVGQVVGMRIPLLKDQTTIRAKIHAVEPSGQWIENQELTNRLLAENERRSAPTTIILFFPYQQIDYVVASIAMPSLLEEP
jgi:hypothetical protein